MRQLWTASRTNTIFGDNCHIAVSDDSLGNGCLQLPFVDGAWTYEWHVVGTAGLPESSLPQPKARGLGIHRPTSTSHVAALPSESAAAAMHRRLLAGVERLRRLPSCTADAPPSLSKARNVDNAASITANATRASHTAHRYEPSYPGRLIHADIAGPFRGSHRGGARYLLVLVDDHSRFKAVYFLKRKSEAPACIRKFVAGFTALINHNRSEPALVIGSLHTDNAGEFLSREFTQNFLTINSSPLPRARRMSMPSTVSPSEPSVASWS